jgi:hypothetical protein
MYHSKLKDYVKFHYENNRYAWFYSETKGKAKFHSQAKIYVKFRSETNLFVDMYCHLKGCCVTYKTGFGLDDWIY